MESEAGDKDTESEEAELRLQIHTLKQELQECRAELSRLQKQLNQSERLHRNTESYNEDLRKQVSADLQVLANLCCNLSSSFIFDDHSFCTP